MKFKRKDRHHAESECGGYVINRVGLIGGGAYCAVRLGSPSESLAVERFEDDNDEARRAAYAACVRVCREDAA